MERDAEGSKIKGPPPVRAGPHYHQLAPLLHKKHGGLRPNLPNPKKSAPHQIVVLPSGEYRKKLYNYVSKKAKVSLDSEFLAFPNEFKSDAFPKDICFVNKS